MYAKSNVCPSMPTHPAQPCNNGSNRRERERAKPFRTHSMQPGSLCVHTHRFRAKAKKIRSIEWKADSQNQSVLSVSARTAVGSILIPCFGLCRHGISPLGSAAAEGGGKILAVLPSGLFNAFLNGKMAFFQIRHFPLLKKGKKTFKSLIFWRLGSF